MGATASCWGHLEARDLGTRKMPSGRLRSVVATLRFEASDRRGRGSSACLCWSRVGEENAVALPRCRALPTFRLAGPSAVDSAVVSGERDGGEGHLGNGPRRAFRSHVGGDLVHGLLPQPSELDRALTELGWCGLAVGTSSPRDDRHRLRIDVRQNGGSSPIRLRRSRDGRSSFAPRPGEAQSLCSDQLVTTLLTKGEVMARTRAL